MASVNIENIARSAAETGSINILDHYDLIEQSMSKIQAIPGSYTPVVRIQPNENLPNIGGDLTFQISPQTTLDVYDMQNSYIKLITKRRIQFEYQTRESLGSSWQNANVPKREKTFEPGIPNYEFFFGEKHSAGLIKVLNITAGDKTVYNNQDFVYETNILRALYTDEAILRQNSLTTYAYNVDNEKNSVVGAIFDLHAAVTDMGPITLEFTYESIIPAVTFNLLARLRWLPSFFSLWQLRITPTIENMVCKIVTRSDRIPEDYHEEVFFPRGQWMELFDKKLERVRFTTVENLTINSAEFYASSYKLMEDRYAGLVSLYSANPLKIPFNSVNSAAGKGINNLSTRPDGFILDNHIRSTIPQIANRIDSVFISFHQYDGADGSLCVQPFAHNVRVTVNDTLYPIYPINTYNDPIVRNMFLDAINIQNNTVVTLNRDFDHSLTPYKYLRTTEHPEHCVENRTLRRGDITNFLLAIPLASDGSHNEGLYSKGGNLSWLIEGTTEDKYSSYIDPRIPPSQPRTPIDNPFKPRRIVITAVQCETLLLFSRPTSTMGQVQTTNQIMNA